MKPESDRKGTADDVVVVPYGSDNFAYLLPCGPGGACLVIDPGDAESVLRALAEHDLQPERLLITHGHADHTAGAARIAAESGCKLAGIPASGPIAWAGGQIEALAVPGHTREAVAYVDAARGLVFTGDTLFVAGCGRLFECDAATMWRSLLRLRALPEDLRVYPGHNYTADNLAFGAALDPGDTAVAERLARARRGDALVPSTLREERRTNPFLRCDDPAFRERIGLAHLSPEACFAELRRRKDRG